MLVMHCSFGRRIDAHHTPPHLDLIGVEGKGPGAPDGGMVAHQPGLDDQLLAVASHNPDFVVAHVRTQRMGLRASI